MIKRILLILLCFPLIAEAAQGYKTRYNPFTSKQDYIIDVSNIEAGNVTATGTISGVTVIQSGIPVATVSDAGYSAAWNGITDVAPSKNAVYDVVSGLGGGHDPVTIDTNVDDVFTLTGQLFSYKTQTANRVFAGPASGAAAVPTFRALVDDDVPNDITITEADPIGIYTVIPFAFKPLGGTIIINTSLTKTMGFAGTVTGWRVSSPTSSSITIQVNKSTTASPDEQSFAEISGTEDITLSTAFQNQDLALGSWTATFSKGDSIQFIVTSATAGNPADVVRGVLYVTKTGA